MATYAIGDIQGCYDSLQSLLALIEFDPKVDTLWLAGDIINRGPKSLKTLRYIYSLGDSAVTVLGNHDLHLLAVAHGARKPSRSDTLDNILNAKDCDELLHWLQQQPLIHRDKKLGYTMVHAGIPPQWTLKQALKHAAEVEQVLQSKKASKFFENMYGNTPSKWSDELKGTDRWRVITNYFTRMRFCTKKGKLELTIKDSSKPANDKLKPWFSHNNRKTIEDKIVFGHWAALQGKVDTANVFALDTGCVWGGELTAMRLEDEKFFRCKAVDYAT